MNSAYCLISSGDLHFLPCPTDTDAVNSQPPTARLADSYSDFLNNRSMISLTNDKFLQTPGLKPGLASAISAENSSSDSLSSFGYPSEVNLHQTISERQISAPTYPIIRGTPAESHVDPKLENLLSHYSTHSMLLPEEFVAPSNLGSPAEQQAVITELLFKVFPHWRSSSTSTIEIKQLTGGITNMLLSCKRTTLGSRKPEIVLVRTYGRGTDLIIDRDREFVSQLLLNSLSLAPPIYAKFGNGLVYGYIPGRSLLSHEMSHPLLYPLIAQRLGQWHSLLSDSEIEESITKLKRFNTKPGDKRENTPRNIWDLMSSWIDIVPENDGLCGVCKDNRDIQEAPEGASLKQVLRKEMEWVLSEIGSKSPFATCHCDLLSGNIIITQSLSKALQVGLREGLSHPPQKDDLTFIDYEYMMPGPRAFDISNHFMEWQGFECEKSRIPEPTPQNSLLRKWSKAYLSSSGSDVSSQEIDALIEEIALFYGMPGFYWGIWAGIQSDISLIDFDYSGYSCTRLGEYWDWKRKYLKK
ncbi:unnamed protein product [Kuraishia capsulata CBS 1993]|uniref:ethanolamine kinase n=1 Tax=Kuraishia capsulata CBS 1993 TaxID=1382522 RepID=W6MFV3_9ASCO|nr:uncharacterized protein KUCA_T00000786001 [Kuraishia capsulata CBS 1993]CDK24819.1 unnamed protein product [Kuraishia capsulata CBS 1993]